jgi:hypothetical protein
MYYNVSKVPSLAGYNYYTSMEEYIQLFVDYLYKNTKNMKNQDKEELHHSEQNIESLINIEEKVEFKLNEAKIDKNIISEIMQDVNQHNNINSLDELTNKCLRIEEIIPDNIKKDVIPFISSRLNCSFGTHTEKDAISLYYDIFNRHIYANNSELLKLNVNDKFYICGKIDGKVLISEKEFIVEIKNRKNKLLEKIPKYELVQILLYSKILKNNNICFIQKFKEELQVDYIDTNSSLDYSKLFDEIIERLNNIDTLISELLKNKEERLKFLTMSKVKMYIYLKNKLKFLPYKK